MAQSRKEAGIDRQVKELYKSYLKGLDKATDQLKREPLTTEELTAKIKEEGEALTKLEAMFDLSGDFAGMLEEMRGHIAGLVTVSTHVKRADEYSKKAKKDIRTAEHEKAQAKAAKENAKANA